MALKEYNKKRNFEKTPEPKGKAEKNSKRLRFVVQHHIARREHYDFRLEWNGALLSWAVPKGPSYNTRDKRLAIMVEDHPLEYRNFEGTIPKGEYGGGTVMLWDEGFWEPYGDVNAALHGGSLKFELKGQRLKGKWALIRMKEKAGEAGDNWLLLKEKDELAQAAAGIAEFVTSVRTGRSMAEIESGKQEKTACNPFDKAEVQLARLADKIPAGKDWLYEVKYDGYRIVAYAEKGGVRLLTRNGKDYTGYFEQAARSIAEMAGGRAMVLDGEMTVTNESGKTDFQALQGYMKNPRGKSLTYIVFDLLALDGADLREKSLLDRKAALEALMKGCPANLHYSKHVEGAGKESLAAACKADLEGIIGKKADSPYSGTRNGDWIKLKCEKRQEFVIGGYTLTDKKTSGISALLLGVFESGRFIYIGRAGTGLSGADMEELEPKFAKLNQPKPPFENAPKARSNEKITWLKPKLVAEIKFAEFTDQNLLRQASFKGLRADKSPTEVTLERQDEKPPAPKQAGGSVKTGDQTKGGVIIEGVKISSPDKVIYSKPKITKADVAHYYEQVAGRMLPYVGNRVLSAVSCPKGVSQSCFFKKHPTVKSKGTALVPVTNSESETEDYFCIKDASGIISEVQLGTLEFHIWGSRADKLEKPDMMVFDLDPDEGMKLGTVRQGVLDLKSVLDELSLVSYLKTSGGKGYHVVVPLKPLVSWEVFYAFARRVAEVMEQKWPDRYTSNVRKAKRKNKIFIDWIRNGRGATSIAPYSVRAREGAKVSMPIDWSELGTVAPDGIDMAGAIARIAGPDPWEGFFKNNCHLKSKLL